MLFTTNEKMYNGNTQIAFYFVCFFVDISMTNILQTLYNLSIVNSAHSVECDWKPNN